MELDERAIYGWINPAKPADEVKSERRRMVMLLSVRYGVHHYLDDIWQEWQLAVYQRSKLPPGPPAAEREIFTFGIARNLCRSCLRKEQRTVPILTPSTPAGEASAGIRECDLDRRRMDGLAGPINKPPDSPSAGSAWTGAARLPDCLRRLRPRVQQVLRETYVEGRPSHEVGERVGLSPENVRQQLRRARDELRRCMGVAKAP